jgi:hypothetical protein
MHAVQLAVVKPVQMRISEDLEQIQQLHFVPIKNRKLAPDRKSVIYGPDLKQSLNRRRARTRLHLNTMEAAEEASLHRWQLETTMSRSQAYHPRPRV